MPWTGTIMLVAPLTGWLTKRPGRHAVVLADSLGGLLALLLPGRQVPTPVTGATPADTSAVPVG